VYIKKFDVIFEAIYRLIPKKNSYKLRKELKRLLLKSSFV